MLDYIGRYHEVNVIPEFLGDTFQPQMARVLFAKPLTRFWNVYAHDAPFGEILDEFISGATAEIQDGVQPVAITEFTSESVDLVLSFICGGPLVTITGLCAMVVSVMNKPVFAFADDRCFGKRRKGPENDGRAPCGIANSVESDDDTPKRTKE